MRVYQEARGGNLHALSEGLLDYGPYCKISCYSECTGIYCQAAEALRTFGIQSGTAVGLRRIAKALHRCYIERYHEGNQDVDNVENRSGARGLGQRRVSELLANSEKIQFEIVSFRIREQSTYSSLLQLLSLRAFSDIINVFASCCNILCSIGV